MKMWYEDIKAVLMNFIWTIKSYDYIDDDFNNKINRKKRIVQLYSNNNDSEKISKNNIPSKNIIWKCQFTKNRFFNEIFQ